MINLAICNVSPFNKENFYKRIGQILKKGGFAVIRSVVFGSTASSFEKKLEKHLKIVEKEFGKQGIFAEHFPIYFMRPK